LFTFLVCAISCAISCTISCFAAGVPVWEPRILDSLPHSADRYTQGLFFDGAELWESTGLVGKSRVFRMDARGKVLDSLHLAGPEFGEGIAMQNGVVAWLTWQHRKAFVLSPAPLQVLAEYPIGGEGWGLAPWRGEWVLSDGTGTLFRYTPAFQLLGKIEVPGARLLNELEVVGDTLFANIYTSDSIAVISLPAGKITRYIDCSKLARAVRKKNPQAEVLNGIAWDGKSLWITGKLWPVMYRIE
jgi:glutamine cyclotransferase